jgi:hypothetical protein
VNCCNQLCKGPINSIIKSEHRLISHANPRDVTILKLPITSISSLLANVLSVIFVCFLFHSKALYKLLKLNYFNREQRFKWRIGKDMEGRFCGVFQHSECYALDISEWKRLHLLRRNEKNYKQFSQDRSRLGSESNLGLVVFYSVSHTMSRSKVDSRDCQSRAFNLTFEPYETRDNIYASNESNGKWLLISFFQHLQNGFLRHLQNHRHETVTR